MLDHFAIATKGGVVLWAKDYTDVTGNPVNALIQDVLIQSTQTSSTKHNSGSYTLQWAFANELNVIFVAVYQKMLQLPYLDDLLTLVKRHFVARFAAEIRMLTDGDTASFPSFDSFDEEFDLVWQAVEERFEQMSKSRQGVPRKFEDTRKFQTTARGAKLELEELAQANEMEISRKPAKMRSWEDRHGGHASDGKKGRKGKKGKENRVWDGKASKESSQALDFSGGGSESEANVAMLVDEKSKGVRTKDGVYE
ncbi:hypothetical protein GGF47_002640, partial [Coemansia sp. RSA 2524]